ncbi:MAG: T9SS type A sorting domain-containing protein [Flavobacteriales bacterium]|nr:T9SS type A sorting domain-containing protein [Flavobacteriales bacterium]
MKNPILLTSALLALNGTAQTIENHWWTPNNAVNAVVRDDVNGLVYIGGSFTQIGPNMPFGAEVDAATGLPDMTMAKINGQVHTAAPDGSGGWYIGGDFTLVGGLARNRAARINANGSVHAWDPNANAVVRKLLVDGTTIFIGGDFSSIGGQSRNRIAALDAATGVATSWNASAAGFGVYDMVRSGTSLFVCGVFSNMGGQARANIAELNASTAVATAWNPSPNNNVYALDVDGSTVYAGGFFTSIGGGSRNYIAALDASTGLVTSWNAGANNAVLEVIVDGSLIYAGGDFTSIGGQSRARIAALNSGTALANAFNPSANGTVYAIKVLGGTVYAAGTFSTIGGQSRGRIAALNSASGTATTWNPNPDGTIIRAIAAIGSTLYMGGDFRIVGGVLRNRIAALSASTGQPTSWNPDANSSVMALALNGTKVYAAGAFSTIGGSSRAFLAELSAITGLASAWNPAPAGSVQCIVPSGSLVYVGGGFSNIGGQPRNRIAALDATSGTATTWNPNANNAVTTLLLDGSTMYAGGDFTTLGGQPRVGIAAVDITSGAVTAWNPSANGPVRALLKNGTTVYAGGQFTNIGGQGRNYIAALDAGTGLATSWNANANNFVLTLGYSGSRIYAGGIFGVIGGQSRSYLAALSTATGLATAWNPSVASTQVSALAVGINTIDIGGSFTGIAAQSRPYFAVFSCEGTLWYPDQDGDGLGDAGGAISACELPAGHVGNDDDCDDSDDNLTMAGAACDDGDPLTENDTITEECECVGTPVVLCTEHVTVEIRTDAMSSQASWEILDQTMSTVLCQFTVPVDGITSPISEDCCLPAGCYRLRVLDSGGDGFVSGGFVGGYQLREQGVNGRRIIDNMPKDGNSNAVGNFSTGSSSAISNTYDNGAFCVPIGNDQPIFASCDKLDWVNNQFIVATENSAVTFEFNNTNTTSGYEFWIYDPNGSYSYRRFRSHATSDGFGSGATRACHMKINGWINNILNPHVPANVLMNVRIRGRVANNNLPFGPACLMKLDPPRAACPIVKLQDNPLNVPDFSCGVNKNFGGPASSSNRITANPPQFQPPPLAGGTALRYQFRLRIPGEIPNPGSCIVRPPQASATLNMNWTTGDLLECNTQYEVDVRVSKDGGATWCVDVASPACSGGGYTPWGKVCTVNIQTSTFCPGPFQGGGSSLAAQDGDLTLFPNPNQGDQFFVSLTQVAQDVETITVDIFDMTGKRLSARTIAVQDGALVNQALDLNGELAGGLYLVNITAGEKTYSERLVIQP